MIVYVLKLGSTGPWGLESIERYYFLSKAKAKTKAKELILLKNDGDLVYHHVEIFEEEVIE